MSELRIGISGWTYANWRGVFYPKGLVQRRELEFASRQMNSVEINGTFYSLQRPASYRKWHDATPDDFVFSIKGSKYITHRKGLKDIRQPLANFFASGLLALGSKLGPILWQFPPWFRYDRDKVKTFLELLPQTSYQAAELALEHNLKQKHWTLLEPVAKTKLRYAFEVRHDSFMNEDFVKLLRKYNAAVCFADTAGKWPYAEDLTSDIVYIRLHGAELLYTSGYTEDQLQHWADRIRQWSAGEQPQDARLLASNVYKPGKPRSVYVYFDNDIEVHAPFDAIRLAAILSGAEEFMEYPTSVEVRPSPATHWG
jgi:uncharacterized protein YecE (DUF72 family)